MNYIFEKISQYGFHDTEIHSIELNGSEISLNFNNGIYLLDESGKETVLSEPIQIILKINSTFCPLKDAMEIREYGKKLNYLTFSSLKKCLKKDTFGILMMYYSNFNNSILLDGGICDKQIIFSIEGIDEIVVRQLNKV